MSRIRTNIITNRMANGAPTVSNGLVISGVTTTSEIFVGTVIKLDPVSGIVTATNFKKSDGSDVGAATVVTIGVRTGTAVTFSATGSSFNVVGRSGNIPISI